jgi:hypothetical protein
MIIRCTHCDEKLDWEDRVVITYSSNEGFCVCTNCSKLPHKDLRDNYTSQI